MQTELAHLPAPSSELTLPPGDRNQPAGSWAVQAAQYIFLHFPAPDVLEVDLFFLTAGQALADFPLWVIAELVSPKQGIIACSKWTPKIAELVKFCEDRMQARERRLYREACTEAEARFRRDAAEHEARNQRIADIRRAAMSRLDGSVFMMGTLPGMESYQARDRWESRMVRETPLDDLGDTVDVLNGNKDLIAAATEAEMLKRGTGWPTIEPTVLRRRAEVREAAKS
jgi:hypothetical protein